MSHIVQRRFIGWNLSLVGRCWSNTVLTYNTECTTCTILIQFMPVLKKNPDLIGAANFLL